MSDGTGYGAGIRWRAENEDKRGCKKQVTKWRESKRRE